MLPMPNITPPTDNLYKFLAFIGLLMVVLPLGALAAFRLQGEGARRATLHALDSAMLANDATMRELDGKQNLDAMIASNKQMATYAQTAHEAVAEWTRQGDNYRIWFWPSIGMAASGVAVSAVGFTLWWKRVQKFQDTVLRAQATAPPKA